MSVTFTPPVILNEEHIAALREIMFKKNELDPKKIFTNCLSEYVSSLPLDTQYGIRIPFTCGNDDSSTTVYSLSNRLEMLRLNPASKMLVGAFEHDTMYFADMYLTFPPVDMPRVVSIFQDMDNETRDFILELMSDYKDNCERVKEINRVFESVFYPGRSWQEVDTLLTIEVSNQMKNSFPCLRECSIIELEDIVSDFNKFING